MKRKSFSLISIPFSNRGCVGVEYKKNNGKYLNSTVACSILAIFTTIDHLLLLGGCTLSDLEFTEKKRSVPDDGNILFSSPMFCLPWKINFPIHSGDGFVASSPSL